MTCKDCNGSGKIQLFTSTVDCSCHGECLQDYDPDLNIRNAWYSKTVAANCGCVVYEHSETGQEVTITEISSKNTHISKASDLKFVGTIAINKHIRGEMY